GDYQRQLFLIDHAGLPLKTVLEQIDLLAEEVVPVLRREMEAKRPEHVPSHAPTHAERVARAREAGVAPAPGSTARDRWTGRTAEDDRAAEDDHAGVEQGAARRS
ncbi:5,10-methylene tetrahydromethanopterin reductase, partial [Georgenia sp. 10Sc9-8]|nr:5,10-methylene tetrahydromethanopterin reductase [Georgenia halotolerans]